MKKNLKVLNIIILLFFLFTSKNNFCQNQADTNLVFIVGGKFFMGNPNGDNDEKDLHKVKINNFFINKYEVRNYEYAEFLNSEGNKIGHNFQWILLSGSWKTEKCRIYYEDSIFKVEKGFENYPVTFVSWFGADAYCKWKGGRLPTEAEWEYLAKCGIKTKDEIVKNYNEIASYSENSEFKINPVGSKNADCFGIYDLFGNLSEWTNDWYSEEYYKFSEKKNPQGAKVGNVKVIRGGSWYNNVETLSPTERRAVPPNTNNITIGFRVAYSVL